MNEIAFSTPGHTIISTPHKAFAKFREKFQPHFRIKQTRGFHFLFLLSHTRRVVDCLWQGAVHLGSREQPDIREYGKRMNEFWLTFTDAAMEDVKELGLTWSDVIDPTRAHKNVPHYHHPCTGSVTLARMLSCQFHIHDTIPTFLMRHLAARITLTAYGDIVQARHASHCFAMLASMPIEDRWQDTPELPLAASVFEGRITPTHDQFGYEVMREAELISDLWELTLRQMAEPYDF
jgi:hypothetical protein